MHFSGLGMCEGLSGTMAITSSESLWESVTREFVPKRPPTSGNVGGFYDLRRYKGGEKKWESGGFAVAVALQVEACFTGGSKASCLWSLRL
jgi:hypothetical protein